MTLERKKRARRPLSVSRRVRFSAAVLAGIATAGCSRALEPGVQAAFAGPAAGAAAMRGRMTQATPLPPPVAVAHEHAPLLPPPGMAAQDPMSLPGPVPAAGARPEDSRRFTLLPGVTLSPLVKEKVTRLADAYHRRTGKPLVITSGARDASEQAEAMYELFRLGADVTSLYRNKSALREIQQAYEDGRASARPTSAVVAAMAEVIRRQVVRGVYISAHLRAGAVDVRNRDMSTAEKRALLDAVAEVGGVSALEEAKPPHYHLQVD